jgi:hypothetical protein
MKSKIEKRWSGYVGLNAKHMPDILVADVEVRVGDEVSINGSRRAGDLAGQITWRDNKGFCCKNRRGIGERLLEPWVKEC